MKKLLPFVGVLLCTYLNAQTTTALPQPVYTTMVKACTSVDITMLQGGAGSINVEGESVAILQDFITEMTMEKPSTPQAATIMCLIHGTEFVSGSVYLTKIGGAVVFNVGGVEYVNALNSKGVDFFRSVVAM